VFREAPGVSARPLRPRPSVRHPLRQGLSRSTQSGRRGAAHDPGGARCRGRDDWTALTSGAIHSLKCSPRCAEGRKMRSRGKAGRAGFTRAACLLIAVSIL
jgi:hypothetical protein